MNLYICVLIFFSMNIKVTAHQFMLIQSLNDIFSTEKRITTSLCVCLCMRKSVLVTMAAAAAVAAAQC